MANDMPQTSMSGSDTDSSLSYAAPFAGSIGDTQESSLGVSSDTSSPSVRRTKPPAPKDDFAVAQRRKAPIVEPASTVSPTQYYSISNGEDTAANSRAPTPRREASPASKRSKSTPRQDRLHDAVLSSEMEQDYLVPWDAREVDEASRGALSPIADRHLRESQRSQQQFEQAIQVLVRERLQDTRR